MDGPQLRGSSLRGSSQQVRAAGSTDQPLRADFGVGASRLLGQDLRWRFRSAPSRAVAHADYGKSLEQSVATAAAIQAPKSQRAPQASARRVQRRRSGSADVLAPTEGTFSHGSFPRTSLPYWLRFAKL